MTSPMTLTVLEALNGAKLIGPLTLNDVIVNGDTTLNGNATVNGDITSTGTVQGADLVATDDLTVGDDATIGGDLAVTGTLGVTGASTLAALSADAGTFSGLLTTNGQVKFPAVQNPSADPNTLDDYEEGTWTPTLTFSTPGNLNVVYSVRVGTYFKIGGMVTLTWAIVTTTWTHTTASGSFTLSGVPFAAATIGNGQWTGVLSESGIITVSGNFWTNRILSTNSTIQFVGQTTTGSGRNLADTSHATSGTQQANFGTLTYQAA